MQHNSLIHLINSLDQGERRYVRIRLKQSTGGRSNNFSRMLETLLKGKAIGESHERNGIRSYNVVKHQLFRKILEALTGLDKLKDEEAWLRERILEVRCLIERKLFSPAETLLAQAIARAEQQGQYYPLFELYDLRLRLYHAMTETKKLSACLEGIKISRGDMLEETKWSWELQELSYRSFISLKTEWVKGKEWGVDLLRRVKRIDPSRLPSSRLRITYFQVLSAIRFSRNETEKAYECLLRIRAEFHDSPMLITRFFNQYIATMNNLNLLLVERKHFAEVNENVRVMRSVKTSNADRKLRIVERVLNAELAVLRAARRFGEGEELLKEAAYVLKNRKLSPVYRLMFRFDLCVFRLLRGENKTALEWLNEIKKEKGTSIRPDIHACCEVLEMILLFATSQTDRLEKVLAKKRRRERVYRPDGMLELFTRHFERLLKDPLQEKKYNEELLTKLPDLIKDPAMQKTYAWNFPFTEWARRALVRE